MDANLVNLESAGRTWRQKNGATSERNGNPKGSGAANEPSSERTDAARAADERHHRKRQRPWLPVVVSSSFVPFTNHGWNLPNKGALPTDSVSLIALWSRTCACDSCSYVPLEEEVQAGWDTVAGENDVLGAVSCPRCGSMVMPMLGFREMSVEEALDLKDPCAQNINDADFAELPPQIGPFIDPGKRKVSFVTYISPASLRLSLGKSWETVGSCTLDKCQALISIPNPYFAQRTLHRRNGRGRAIEGAFERTRS